MSEEDLRDVAARGFGGPLPEPTFDVADVLAGGRKRRRRHVVRTYATAGLAAAAATGGIVMAGALGATPDDRLHAVNTPVEQTSPPAGVTGSWMLVDPGQAADLAPNAILDIGADGTVKLRVIGCGSIAGSYARDGRIHLEPDSTGDLCQRQSTTGVARPADVATIRRAVHDAQVTPKQAEGATLDLNGGSSWAAATSGYTPQIAEPLSRARAEVPDVLGKRFNEAVKAVRQAGYPVTVVTASVQDPASEGIVAVIKPPAGSDEPVVLVEPLGRGVPLPGPSTIPVNPRG